MSEYYDYDYDPPEPFEGVHVTSRTWTTKDGKEILFEQNVLKKLEDYNANIPIMLKGTGYHIEEKEAKK